MSEKPKATLILVHFDNGSRMEGLAETAAKAWEYIEACESFAATHGLTYPGPYLMRISPPKDKLPNSRGVSGAGSLTR